MGFLPVRTSTKVAGHKAAHKTTLDAKDDMYKGKPDSAGKTYQDKTRNMSKADKEKYRQEHPEEYAAYTKDKHEQLPGYQYYKDGKKDIKDNSGLKAIVNDPKFVLGSTALMALPAVLPLFQKKDTGSQQQQPDPQTNGTPQAYA